MSTTEQPPAQPSGPSHLGRWLLSSKPLLGIAWAIALTLVIAVTAAGLTRFEIVGPTIPFAYPWRLVQPEDLARLTAWGGYAAHQLSTWMVLWAAQRQRPGFAGGFRWFNWAMLGVHTLFIGLHTLQTHLFYDGLAVDVPEVTALGSVALMLMVVLALEAPRRGLVWGRGTTLPGGTIAALKKSHGTLFTWALVYTFWYHPTEGTFGHLMGFAYLFALLWQSVLIFQRSHLNRRWTLVLELLVIPHGVLVAIHQGLDLWPMFAFGFSAVFIVTQMHGLDWSSRLRQVTAATWLIAVVVIYVVMDRVAMWHEVLRIPTLDYGVVGLIALGFWLRNRARRGSSIESRAG
ncbi:MAG: hypothetical protein VX498_04320 [Myxococcota bacterium]|nr:hypothetical protein [Myxococcota bacterium]